MHHLRVQFHLLFKTSRAGIKNHTEGITVKGRILGIFSLSNYLPILAEVPLEGKWCERKTEETGRCERKIEETGWEHPGTVIQESPVQLKVQIHFLPLV